jgi:hypothetical protein
MYVHPPLGSSSRSPSSPCERTTLMATLRSRPLTSLPRCTTANDPSPTFGPTCRQPGKGHGHISPKTIMYRPAATYSQAPADRLQQIATRNVLQQAPHA